MLSLQQLARIAAAYFTAMADAMLAACVAKAVETGEALDIPERPRARTRGERPGEDVDWGRMVESNGDTRWQHV